MRAAPRPSSRRSSFRSCSSALGSGSGVVGDRVAGQAPPPTEQVVHAQEHGRVVVQYRPGIAREKLEQLVALYEEDPQHVLLVENATGMRCEVAATAWGHGVLCETLTDRSFDALRAFRDRYRDRGPESVA